MASPPVALSGASAATLPGMRSRRSSNLVWPNPVPLECGVIRIQEKLLTTGLPKQTFHVSQLKKTLVYAKNKGKSGYPNIRFHHWLHIATTKLNMTEDLAWLYFETFDAVSEISATDRLELLKTLSQVASQEQLAELRKKFSVDTLRFVLFLYLQNAPRYSLKSAVTRDEWPSPESDLRQKSYEHYHLTFLQANLNMLLELLQESSLLSEEAVAALDFVFYCSIDSIRCSLLTLALSVLSQAGYSMATKSFNATQFEFWLRSLLVTNPYGPRILLSKRRELNPAICFRSDSYGRVLINPDAPPYFRCSLLHRVDRQTVAISDESLYHSAVYVRNCQRSNIYLLTPLRFVQVEKCSHCVLVLGAVTSVVTLNNCDSITIITACRSIHVSGSSTCVLHLLTMTRPLLLPACLHITLAPYNAHYPQQRSHLALAGLSSENNYWDSPLDLSHSGSDGNNSTPVWGIMPPEVFRVMEVPFDLPGSTEGVPCCIPIPYRLALGVRKERLREWYDHMEKAKLSKEQSTSLWNSVKDQFEEWLVKEGYKKELIDLGQKSMHLGTQLDQNPRNIGSTTTSHLATTLEGVADHTPKKLA